MAEASASAVGGRKITSRGERFDTPFGFSLYVEPGDYSSGLIVQDGVFEVPETDLVTRLVGPGNVCIDGGCHIGYYTCLMAKLAGPSGQVYAFDANPWCCERTRQSLALNSLNSAEVIQAALGNEQGVTSFHLASDDQTGLSSLGRIDRPKNIISVPWLRLDDFLNERGVKKVHLLKLDVEGAEKLVLEGLGKALADHRIDFLLLECYDERLKLLRCSTREVAELLQDAGYVPWEYGTELPSGWSRAPAVNSRGDCNYLFAAPGALTRLPSLSLAGPMLLAVAKQYEQRQELEQLANSLREREQEEARLRGELNQTSDTLRLVIQSRGWRLLNFLHRVRNFVLFKTPPGERRP